MTKPDVLLIVLDTLRRDRLSGYGHRRETSPALDAFAARATIFDRAVSPAQWTIPAHASLFTGLYPGAHRLTEAGDRLSGAFPTLAEILRGEGYHTVGFCNNPLVGVLDNGLARGFERFFNYAGTVPNRPFDTGENRLARAFKTRFRRFARPIENRFAASDTLFRLSMNRLIVPLWTRLVNYKGSATRTVDDLIAYHRSYRAGGAARPLFTFVNLMGAHLPYHPPPEILNRIAPELRHDRQAADFVRRFNADAARWASPSVPPLEDWQREALIGYYDAEIAHQDADLGRLLRYLERSGALENTLMIILADHGEGHGDHDFFGHSFVVYQELVHVPLIIHYPNRFPPGKRIATAVSTRRVFHTVLEAAGIHPPLDEADPNADVAALTLANATNGQPDIEGGLAFAEAFPPRTFLNFIQHRSPALIERMRLSLVRRGIYDGAYKLAAVGGQIEALYDVAADPAENTNLAETRADLAAGLLDKLAAFAADHPRPDAAPLNDLDDSALDHLRGLGYVE
ncbi:MAG: sulfatase-like hydrolase/transferase [Chloroflexi bacterium]|nr:sulfatase-like hydrolase/transferase [Chloroflexota bacterium]